MSSTFGGLNILSRSLYANQASLNTVGHNIANAGTDGYSRQRVNLEIALPSGEVYGRNKNYAGSGVTVASITRARDIFTDRQLWKESSSLSYSQTSSAALSKLEKVFTEPSETGIQTVLNQFWTAWQTLSTDASDSGARTTVAQKGVALVNAMQHAAEQLRDSAANINREVVDSVGKINQITQNINKLNEQIYFTEFSGTNNANDLRDSRDLLVDELSKLMDITVTEDSTGRYTIQSNSVNLVDETGKSTNGLTLVSAKGYCIKLDTKTTLNDTTTGTPGYDVTTVVVADTGNDVQFTNDKGELKGLLDSRDSSSKGINAYMTNLEKVSKFLLQDFNQVHRSGYGTDNQTGRNFFGEGVIGNTDYLTTYPTTPPDGGWLNALYVNEDITKSTDGLAIIAAKAEVSKITASIPSINIGSGLPTVTTVGGTYTGPGTTDVRIKVSVDSDSGKVNGISSYSMDSGVTWIPSPTAIPDPITSKISLMDIDGLDLEIDARKLVATGNGNMYSFTLPADSSTNESVVSVPPTNKGTGVPKASFTGTYTGGSTATNVTVKVASIDTVTGKISGISYSTDGGTSWKSASQDSTDPELYIFDDIKGVTISLDTSLNSNFIDPADGDIYSMSLSAGNNASGDNAILLGNRLKTDPSLTLGNVSLDSFYSAMIGTLGVQSLDAQRLNANQKTVINQLTNLRASTAGVNLDEEMTDMIRFQKGYNASARVLTTMDEMLDKLINGTGIVGR